MSRAALALATGDELRVQQALDALGLTTLSEDGAVLMKAVAADLDIAAVALPIHAGPRTWNARNIAQHLPLFKEQVDAARILGKGGACVWDAEKTSALAGRHAGKPGRTFRAKRWVWQHLAVELSTGGSR